MGAELVKRDGFQGLIKEFSPVQQDYFYLITVGLGQKEAMKLVNRKSDTARAWRFDSGFGEVERYLIEHRGEYQEEALRYFSANLTALDYGLKMLADKLYDWDNVKQGDKQYVMKAYELLKKISPKVRGIESYDEMILRRVRRDATNEETNKLE